MKFATILLSLLMVFAVVATAAAGEKEGKPEIQGLEYTRGLLNCANAVPIQCGVPVQGSNVGIASLVSTYNCATYTEPGGEVVYILTIPGPNSWSVTCQFSAYTGDPDGFVLTACDESTCTLFFDTSGTKVLTPGTYYVAVDSYGASATWTLTVTCTEVVPPCCPFPQNCYFLDFNQSPNGWTSLACGTGPIPWAWGLPTGGVTIPSTTCDGVPLTNALVTNLTGNYPVSKGEAAVVGPFQIYTGCRCLEICHYYDTESGYDGGNVKVSTDGGTTWTLITPSGGYPGINTSTYYPNECTWNQRMFTGTSTTFIRSCFDISAYQGQTILVGFFFGSESYLTSDRGWAIKWLKIGGTDISPVEGRSWGAIKALYK
jgi:hypothetical protein